MDPDGGKGGGVKWERDERNSRAVLLGSDVAITGVLYGGREGVGDGKLELGGYGPHAAEAAALEKVAVSFEAASPSPLCGQLVVSYACLGFF